MASRRIGRKVAKKSLRIARANAQTGVDAAVTIAARAQRLMSAGAAGAKGREARLMVREKLNAWAEGAVAAQAAWGAFLVKAALGAVRTPQDVAAGLAGIAEAAAKPARRRARANARRLTGAKAWP